MRQLSADKRVPIKPKRFHKFELLFYEPGSSPFYFRQIKSLLKNEKALLRRGGKIPCLTAEIVNSARNLCMLTCVWSNEKVTTYLRCQFRC